MRGKKQQTFAKEKQNNITTTNEREGERAKRGIEQRKKRDTNETHKPQALEANV